jgi:hypothetical protein
MAVRSIGTWERAAAGVGLGAVDEIRHAPHKRTTAETAAERPSLIAAARSAKT